MKLLLIDDSCMQQKIARIYLEKGGEHVLLTANNGKEGLEKARLEQPDIILLDVEMPEMGGLETLELMKSDIAIAYIPVIMCTGNDDNSLEEKTRLMGAAAFIKKPHGFSTLRNVIQDIFRKPL